MSSTPRNSKPLMTCHPQKQRWVTAYNVAGSAASFKCSRLCKPRLLHEPDNAATSLGVPTRSKPGLRKYERLRFSFLWKFRIPGKKSTACMPYLINVTFRVPERVVLIAVLGDAAPGAAKHALRSASAASPFCSRPWPRGNGPFPSTPGYWTKWHAAWAWRARKPCRQLTSSPASPTLQPQP